MIEAVQKVVMGKELTETVQKGKKLIQTELAEAVQKVVMGRTLIETAQNRKELIDIR